MYPVVFGVHARVLQGLLPWLSIYWICSILRYDRDALFRTDPGGCSEVLHARVRDGIFGYGFDRAGKAAGG
jgi:hypothetical protein